MSNLPQELIDKIIGSIDLTSDLEACSLVSHSWRRQSQKQLFSSVRVVGKDLLKKWYHVVSQNGELPSYVRHVCWYNPLHTPDGESPINIESRGRFPSFSNLQSLSLESVDLHTLDNATIESIFGPLGHSLQYLCISDLKTDPGKWRLLASLLPNLQSLSIYKASMGELALEEDNPPSFPFTGHINFCAPETVQFFRWVARSRPCLRGISATGFTSTAVIETLNLVAKNCSATLTTIILGFQPRQEEVAEILKPLDLTSCNNLQALGIQSDAASPAALRTIFNTISSKYLEKLTIGLEARTMFPLAKEYDNVFYSFAKRLQEFGAVKPLKIVVGITGMTTWQAEELDFHKVFPLFSGLGEVVEGNDWRTWRG